MNAESKRDDADHCAGEDKMAADVVKLCTSLRQVCAHDQDLSPRDQDEDLENRSRDQDMPRDLLSLAGRD